MKLYKFSPIKSEKDLEKALKYTVNQLEKLCKEILNESIPITSLKIFPHYPEEYDYLYNLISSKGPKASFSSQTSLYVEVDEMIEGQNIKYLGVRIVDPYRMQVGCGDYEVEDILKFKEKHLTNSLYIRDSNEEMVEIWHPDYDVLGYVVTPV